MAQRGVKLNENKFCCSICLDLLKDPVTIPCGHSYCMDCITIYWDTQEQKEKTKCPQCRQTFVLRPALEKNVVLADLVEDLQRTGLQDEKLQENICPSHDEVMKIFCRTDQQCICYLCSMDEHKGHDTVSAAAERTERQKELGVSQQNIQQRIKERDEKVKVLQQEVETINQSAEKVVSSSEEIFTHLIHLLEKKRSDVRQQVQSQQANQVSRVEELKEKLEKEIAELKKRDAELEQLSHTENHVQFLHDYSLLSHSFESTNSPDIRVEPLSYSHYVLAAVSAIRDELQDVFKEEWMKVSHMEIKENVVVPQAEPKTRAEFLQYSQPMTLDPNTTNSRLVLSEGNTRVTVTKGNRSYPHHPGRFTHKQQVLGYKLPTSRQYWEVEMKIKQVRVEVVVAYNNISRTENDSAFGSTDGSWALVVSDGCYKLIHNKIQTLISGPQSSRIGVFLDHSAGVLCFYSVSTAYTMTLLHRVQTTFTQPLYAGLSVYGFDNFVKLCELK